MNTIFIGTLKIIVTKLVQKKYKDIEIITKGKRLSALDLANAISDYGRKVVMPPDSAFESVDVIEVLGARPKRWDVRLGLWTQEEGLSDLTLELTLTKATGDYYDVEVDNLHVL